MSKLLAATQSGKLKLKESDWKLPGTGGHAVTTRTCNGGNGRPCFEHRFVKVELSSDSEEDVNSEAPDANSVAEEDEEDEEAEEDDERKKPQATRVILEVGPLTDLLQQNCQCPEYDGKVEASLKTLCLATTIVLTCVNPDCTYIDNMHPPAVSKIHATHRLHREDGREWMSDYAINLLYVLGFLSCGDGGTEAGRVLGILGLPNDTTMERRSFGIMEERMASAIKGLMEEILLDNLTEEVKRTVELPNHFELWKQSLNSSIVLDKVKYHPRLRVSFDMAWQQRNSGN